ncbi:MAG: FtsW/RodA/SpoVE family cell cycle protein [Deinococcales bacterium]
MDLVLVFAQLGLGALGILGVAVSEASSWPDQALRIAIAFSVTMIFAIIPSQRIIRLSPFVYVAVLLALVLVLFIGVSPAGSSAQRWFLIGNFTIQPSELMKVAVVPARVTFL